MKILLINSDLAKNRGDRAITEGMVQLIREWNPDAKLTGLSERADRDSKWFGIDFLNMDAQSLNPLDMIKLLREARRSDMVLWGGGELLKDYTNKTALWYWVLKMWLVSLANRNLYGVYQGIGPTKANSSKRLIRFVVGRCRRFAVRDAESYEKLVAWGGKAENILPASDPAVLPSPKKLSTQTKRHLKETFDIDEAFLKDFISIGPRDWFHYKHSGLIPYRYKKKLGLGSKPDPATSQKHVTYIEALVDLSETIIQKGHSILFIPMHMGEEDIELCKYLKNHVTRPESVRILDDDSLSPSEVRSVMSYARAMIGFRLHSTIIATSSSVPCMNYYYVDKGRVYFEQIGQSKNAFPIEDLLTDNFIDSFEGAFGQLLKDRKKISTTISKKLEGMRDIIRASFREMVDGDENN